MRLGGWEAGRMSEERWKKLDVWKLADELAFKIYLATQKFPKEELYGLTSQLRRAALSIPTNIVEGYSRKGDKELASLPASLLYHLCIVTIIFSPFGALTPNDLPLTIVLQITSYLEDIFFQRVLPPTQISKFLPVTIILSP